MRIRVSPLPGFASSTEASWDHFIRELERSGHAVDEQAMARFTEIDALVSFGHSRRALREADRAGVPLHRRILVVLEPSVSSPSLFSQKVRRHYGSILAGSKMWDLGPTTEWFNWPQSLAPCPLNPPGELRLASMVNSEKRSAVRGSLYGLRREVVKQAANYNVSIHVAGAGWESKPIARAVSAAKATARASLAGKRPLLQEAWGDLFLRPVTLLGPVADKASALERCPISIVIENSADYVSEKLVDVIRHGIAPVYVGPPLEQFGLPGSLAVRCEPNAGEILDAVRNLDFSESAEVVRAGRDWLQSDDALPFAAVTVQRRLAGHVSQKLGE